MLLGGLHPPPEQPLLSSTPGSSRCLTGDRPLGPDGGGRGSPWPYPAAGAARAPPRTPAPGSGSPPRTPPPPHPGSVLPSLSVEEGQPSQKHHPGASRGVEGTWGRGAGEGLCPRRSGLDFRLTS